jgi:arylsulfatase A-like enzyme
MRLEQLHAVDDYVAAIANRLAGRGELANTYLIFASDNGYFFGEHRIIAGKYLPYEPSARVPFAIAGPGLPAGKTSSELISNADFAPTVAALAGATPALPVDGRSILPFAANPTLRSGRPVLLEADVGPGLGTRRAGVGDLEQEPGAQRFAANGDRAPAYQAIRSNRWLYVAYSTGETELYDMAKDPGQLQNLRGKRYRRVRRVLRARLFRLGSCSGASCNVTYAKDPKARKLGKAAPGRGR